MVLRETIRSLYQVGGMGSVLFVGSQGRGVLETAGVPMRRYWYHRSQFRLLTLFTYVFSQVQLYRALSRARLPKEAIIYVNTLLPFGAAIWAHRNRRRLVYHIHEVSLSPRALQSFLVWVAGKTADFAIYVSEDNRSRLPIPDTASIVLPNPISTEIARRAGDTQYTPKRSGNFEILMLASPRDYKGVPEFMALANRLLDRRDINFTLVLNAEAAEIENYLMGSKVPANMKVYPRTDQPEQFYARADALLNLSRVDQWIETFGLTLVEAMAFGLPVIAPPIGGPTEIVTGGQEGFLIDSRDLDGLEKKVRCLADDDVLMLQLSDAARRRAQDFTFESFSSKLHKAVSSVATAQDGNTLKL